MLLHFKPSNSIFRPFKGKDSIIGLLELPCAVEWSRTAFVYGL